MPEKRTVSFTLRDLAERVGGAVDGDGDLVIRDVRPLENAGPDELSFFASARYRRQLEATSAGAVIVPRDEEVSGPSLIRADHPYMAFILALELFNPPGEPDDTGVSSRAFVADDCRIGQRAAVHPFAYIGPGCTLGNGVRILPGAVLVSDVAVGDESVIHPNVTIYGKTIIGERVVIHGGSVLGSDGFGYIPTGAGHRKIPQVGRVVVEDDVEIGAGVTIDRATLGETRIRRGTKIDNLVQVAHNVEVGEDSILVAQVGISGSTKVGSRVTLAGQAGTAQHITIGDGATVTGKAGVTKSVKGGRIYSGYPLMEHDQWRRVQAATTRLPLILDRLKRLEKAVFSQAESGGASPSGDRGKGSGGKQ